MSLDNHLVTSPARTAAKLGPTGRSGGTSSESLFHLYGLTSLKLAKLTWWEIRADDVFGRAAQVAYYFFLALFPFLICVIASLSVFGRADRGRALLFEIFARFLPPPAFELINQTFQEIIHSSGPLKMSLGILASLWAASMGMSAVMDALNAAYRVKERRSLIKQYAVAIALTLVIVILLVISILIGLGGESLAAALFQGTLTLIAGKIAQWALALATLLFAFAITFYFAPDVKNRHWHWVTPGAIVGVCLLVSVSAGLRIYLHYAPTYTVTYGSLGAVIVLLICFYLSGIAVLSGGALNGVLERLANGIPLNELINANGEKKRSIGTRRRSD